MTENRYTRPEFEQELREVRKWSAYGAQGSVESAERRLLTWYDSIMYEVSATKALRDALQRATHEKVDAEVRLEEALVRIDLLESKVRIAQADKEEGDD